MTPASRPLCLLLLAAGCASAPRDPVSVAESYARALEENHLTEAYRLTAGAPEGEVAFLERYADEGARRERAAEVRAGAGGLEAHGPALSLEQSGGAWRVVESRPADVPRAALSRFLDAVDGKDWRTAWGLLAAPLRARYTPERLQDDFEHEPLARERLRRARIALLGPVKVAASEASFPIGEDRAVRLVLEEGEYRVAAIE
ncbi:hypothetical protein P2318_17360 [Myxococcaceae bacterium GXIMD 01537]